MLTLCANGKHRGFDGEGLDPCPVEIPVRVEDHVSETVVRLPVHPCLGRVCEIIHPDDLRRLDLGRNQPVYGLDFKLVRQVKANDIRVNDVLCNAFNGDLGINAKVCVDYTDGVPGP